MTQHPAPFQDFSTELRDPWPVVERLRMALREAQPQPQPIATRRTTMTDTTALAQEIWDLISESEGVAGLHPNGDIAPWDELLPGGRFERLPSLGEPIPAPQPDAALAQPPAEGKVAELVAVLRSVADENPDSARIDPRWLTRAADLLERQQQMEDLAADAVSGLRYIEQSHGRLYGVGFDRIYEKADQLRPRHALPLSTTEVPE